jgi:hypothetical protein
MSGALPSPSFQTVALATDPVTALQAVKKEYVDGVVVRSVASPTSTGPPLPLSGFVITYFDTTLGIPIWGLSTW